MRRALFDIKRQAAALAAADRIVWCGWAWCGVQIRSDVVQKYGCLAASQTVRSAVWKQFCPPENCLLAFFRTGL